MSVQIKCISTRFGGRLGNHILLVYKIFKFARLLKLPFDVIKFDKRNYNELYANIKDNFIDDEKYKQHYSDINVFNVQFHNATLTDLIALSKKNYTENDAVLLYGCDKWIYPTTLEDICLFNYLIDGNQYLKQKCVDNHPELFDKNANLALVGLSIRRGDFKLPKWRNHQLLSNTYLNQLVADIRLKYYHRVKILITSDDINEVKDIIKCHDNCIFLKNTTPEEDLITLSYCDYVIGNGNFHRCEDLVTGKYESTFCQIAQILNVSRKFATTAKFNHEYFAKSKYIN